MDNKFFSLLKEFWNAREGKQIIGVLMAIPIGMGFFYHYYYKAMHSDILQENKELKSELKAERSSHAETNKLYLSSVQDCSKELLRNDSIHTAKFNDYRDKVESNYAQTSDKWERAYKEVIHNLVKSKRINEKTSKELININEH